MHTAKQSRHIPRRSRQDPASDARLRYSLGSVDGLGLDQENAIHKGIRGLGTHVYPTSGNQYSIFDGEPCRCGELTGVNVVGVTLTLDDIDRFGLIVVDYYPAEVWPREDGGYDCEVCH